MVGPATDSGDRPGDDSGDDLAWLYAYPQQDMVLRGYVCYRKCCCKFMEVGNVTLWQAVLLGIIQGITEFLPISSSGHLVLAQHFLGITDNALVFDVMVHFGSLFAIVIVLKDEIGAMVTGIFGGRSAAALEGRRLFWQVVVATLPLVVVGLFLRDFVDETFSSALMSAGLLFLTGAFLLYADRTPLVGGQREAGWGHAIWMGVSQAFAVLPGLSRSGITMGTGIMTGLNRESAARFSFLMSIPAILGATVLEAGGLLRGEVSSVAGIDALIVGTVVSAITSYLAVTLFLRFLRSGRLAPFAYYTWIVGAITVWLTWGQ